MTRKASNTSFLYTQTGTDGHSAVIFVPVLFSHTFTAHRICKYNTLPHLDTLLPIIWPLQNLSIPPPFLCALHLPPPPSPKKLHKRKEKWKEERIFLLSAAPHPFLDRERREKEEEEEEKNIIYLCIIKKGRHFNQSAMKSVFPFLSVAGVEMERR